MSDALGPHGASAPEDGPIDRAAAFAAGPTRVPRKFVHWILIGAAALGIGGVLLEHVLTVVGINPTPPSTTATVPASSRSASGAGAEHETTVPGQLAGFMGLSRMTPGQARAFSLVDENGRDFSLASQRGRVVVLSFFDGRCNDICPVVADEIEQADALLGSSAARVSFVTVNTDPAATAVSGLEEVLAKTKLGRMANWHMLTGPLSELSTIWRDYGITVSFDTSTRTVEHNEVIYFLDGAGQFCFSATPFANESRPTGTYVLPVSDVKEFARGIATYARELVDAR
ncbi:MAG: SCO family protein [Acidimicrobiales bacterium]|jgi:protein SCO1/2